MFKRDGNAPNPVSQRWDERNAGPSHLKVPLPSSSLISRLTLKVKRSLSGVSGGACCDDSSAFLAERRKAVAKL